MELSHGLIRVGCLLRAVHLEEPLTTGRKEQAMHSHTELGRIRPYMARHVREKQRQREEWANEATTTLFNALDTIADSLYRPRAALLLRQTLWALAPTATYPQGWKDKRIQKLITLSVHALKVLLDEAPTSPGFDDSDTHDTAWEDEFEGDSQYDKVTCSLDRGLAGRVGWAKPNWQCSTQAGPATPRRTGLRWGMAVPFDCVHPGQPVCNTGARHLLTLG